MAELERRLAGAVAAPSEDPGRGDGGPGRAFPGKVRRGPEGADERPGAVGSEFARASPEREQARCLQDSTSSPQAESNGEPQWPDEAAETAFLAQARFGEPREAAAPLESTVPVPVPEAPVEKEKLPTLEELLPRIPAEVMAALDEHFRAKFTTVRRVPKSALKP